jgi:hypothetical protein
VCTCILYIICRIVCSGQCCCVQDLVTYLFMPGYFFNHFVHTLSCCLLSYAHTSHHSATTHTDLMLRARNIGVRVEIIHNASAMGAAAASGLQVRRIEYANNSLTSNLSSIHLNVFVFICLLQKVYYISTLTIF